MKNTKVLFSKESRLLLEKSCTGIRLEEPDMFEKVIDFIISGKKFIFQKELSSKHEISPPGSVKVARTIIIFKSSLCSDRQISEDLDIGQIKKLDQEVKFSLSNFLKTDEGRNPTILRRLAVIYYICQQEDLEDINKSLDEKEQEENIEHYFYQLLEIFDECQDISHIDIDYLLRIARAYGLPDHDIYSNILDDNYKYHHLKSSTIKNTDWQSIIENSIFLPTLKKIKQESIKNLALDLINKNKNLSKNSFENIFEIFKSKDSSITATRQSLINLLPPEEALAWANEKYKKTKKQSEKSLLIIWLGMFEDSQPILESLKAFEINSTLKKEIEEKLDLFMHKIEIERILASAPSYQSLDFSEEIPEGWLDSLKNSIKERKKKLVHRISQGRDTYESEELEDLEAVSTENLEDLLSFLCSGKEFKNRNIYESIISSSDLLDKPEANINHWIRLELFIKIKYRRSIDHIFLLNNIIAPFEDLRQIADIAIEYKINPANLIEGLLTTSLYEKINKPVKKLIDNNLKNKEIWPLLARYHEYIDSILEREIPMDFKENNIEVFLYDIILSFHYFPSLPNRWNNEAYKISVTGSQRCQLAARKLLEEKGLERERIYTYLHSNKKDERLNAINWLSDLQDKKDLSALNSVLEHEKDYQVKARLLQTIDSLGGDISSFLTPEKLLMEAKEGLKKKAPKSMAWFKEAELPQVFYQNNQAVPNQVLYWWAVLAVSLKEANNGLIRLYTSLLRLDSQTLLSEHVLTKFLAIETGQWSEAGNKPTSAMKEKGLLALISHNYLPNALPKIASFIKQYPLKRAQAEAFLTILSRSDDLNVMQFLLVISTTHKAKSVRICALSLIDQIAERNNWTAEQLADYSVPTLDLEHVYKPTAFPYGKREFSVLLNDNLELIVRNPAGKQMKSLPVALAGEDWEEIRARKAWLSNNKKSLKSIVQQRKIRFKHAMVFAKQWSVTEWCEHLHQHPVQNRMVQRLIWQISIDDNWISFRPLEDGTFSDIHDEGITLPESGQVRLLSANLISAEEIAAWRAHLQDFQITPLIDQLTMPVTQANLDSNKISFPAHLIIEASDLRKYMLGNGYKRGKPQHSAWYNQYIRTIESEGFGVVMEFSGNDIGDFEMGDVSLDCLQVYHLDEGEEVYDWHGPLPLKEVPENMLHHLQIECDRICQKCSEK